MGRLSYPSCFLHIATLLVCQAKSPIRTLDELNVTEVVSSLHFPSIKEREQKNWLVENSSASSLKSESEMSQVSSISCQGKLDGSNEPSQIFGMRKQHRCFVITARAQSFLYHQVCITMLMYSLCWFPFTNCISSICEHSRFQAPSCSEMKALQQVRLLVGVLKCVGTGELTVDDGITRTSFSKFF